MKWLTTTFLWIETRLDEGAWFRRGYVIFATVLTWDTLKWAMKYADTNAAKDGVQIAAIIGAVSAVVAAVQTFAFNSYLNSRKG